MTSLSETRGYFFCHRFLSGIQKGIQALHAYQNIYENYPSSLGFEFYREVLERWEKEKTVIFLDGGDSQNIIEIYNVLKTFDYPSGIMYEDERSLNGAATATGIILDENTPIEVMSYVSQFKLASN